MKLQLFFRVPIQSFDPSLSLPSSFAVHYTSASVTFFVVFRQRRPDLCCLPSSAIYCALYLFMNVSLWSFRQPLEINFVAYSNHYFEDDHCTCIRDIFLIENNTSISFENDYLTRCVIWSLCRFLINAEVHSMLFTAVHN